MKYVASLIVLAVSLIVLPSPSVAYFTTNQEAFTVDGTTGVFVIDFAFGHQKHTIGIPVLAQMNTTPRNNVVSFNVLNSENKLAKGTALGVILSPSGERLQNGMYVVPKGTVGQFRLLVLYTKPADEHNGAFRANVTHLPFTFDTAQQLQLNPSELTRYSTEPLNLTSTVPLNLGK